MKSQTIGRFNNVFYIIMLICTLVLACLTLMGKGDVKPVSGAETTVPEGTGTLAAAVQNAASGDTLLLNGTYIITGPLEIDKPLTIKAASGASVDINKDANFGDRYLYINTTGTVNLEGFTSRCRIIINSGTVNISDCVITGKTGGGIYVNSGTVNITDCEIFGNEAENGGGIYNSGTLTVTGSEISGNVSYMYGGGICNYGTLTVTDCEISGNDALYFSSCNGGGIFNSGTLTVIGSQITDNYASTGGGIYSEGNAYIYASVIAGNSGWDGSGIYQHNYGKLYLYFNTIYGNTGGYYGVYFNSANPAYLGAASGNIILGNYDRGTEQNCNITLDDKNLCTAGTNLSQVFEMSGGVPVKDSEDNYVILEGGLAHDKAELTPELRNTVLTYFGIDLNDRIIGSKLDIGAWESPHTYGLWSVSLNPTVNTKGQLTRLCTICNGRQDFTLPALNTSNYSYSVITSPSCTSDGSGRYTYTKDGQTFTFDVRVSAYGHGGDLVTVSEPTCTQEGTAELCCADCGELLDSDIILSLGHNFGTWNPKDNDSHEHLCTLCNIKETASHTYNSSVTPSSYSSEGFTTYTCSICNHYYTSVIPKLTYTVIPSTGSNVPAGFFNNYILNDILSIPTREDYTFGGWYLDGDFTLPVISISESDLDTNGNITLYAKWTPTINNEDPPEGLSPGAIAGIEAGGAAAVGLGGFAVYWFAIKKKKLADLFKRIPR